MEVDPNFWKDRNVFVTGHTGFKGGWLVLWLIEMGANVYGYSKEPPTRPNFFEILKLKNKINHELNDIRDFTNLKKSIQRARPSVIFHLAAQPIVKESYFNPLETYSTNVMGTINLFESIRDIEAVKAVVNVTSDKCYENHEQNRPFNELDKLGGHDPYSSSKSCSEIITSSYRSSFFSNVGVKVASARAGNVIGGGDWGRNRLIPDFFRSLDNNESLYVRSPNATRPWQHVLEPLSGYLLLAEKLVTEDEEYSGAWNFGPEDTNSKSVSWIINKLSEKFSEVRIEIINSKKQYEANFLSLDISKVKSNLGWYPRWSLEMAIDNTIKWHQALKKDINMKDFSLEQIRSYIVS